MCGIIELCQEYPWGQNSVQRVKTTHDDGDKRCYGVIYDLYAKGQFRKRGHYSNVYFKKEGNCKGKNVSHPESPALEKKC